LIISLSIFKLLVSWIAFGDTLNYNIKIAIFKFNFLIYFHLQSDLARDCLRFLK